MIRASAVFPPLVRRLLTDRSALAYVEFAYMLPILMALGLGGIELSSMTVAHLRIAQIAQSLADNASRAKQDVPLSQPQLRESDINEVFHAAELQGGDLDVLQNGRLILSSVERNAKGGQYIHWQRCDGAKEYSSSFGVEGYGKDSTSVKGIGPADREVAAEEGYAIMFVEVAYDYKPIIFASFFKPYPIVKTSAMYVRDQRDLTNIYNPSPQAPQKMCS